MKLKKLSPLDIERLAHRRWKIEQMKQLTGPPTEMPPQVKVVMVVETLPTFVGKKRSVGGRPR